jgi:hypothetical protein
LQPGRDLAQLHEQPVRLFRSSPHAGGEHTEIGELPFAAGGELLQPVVLDTQPGQQFLGILLEAVHQPLHAACQ